MTMSTSTTTPRLTQTKSLISQQNYSKFHDSHQQSFISSNNSIDVPMKKYPPLPDISLSSITNRFYRTETILPPPTTKKQIFNHFTSTQRGQLPSLNKRIQYYHQYQM